jgi:AcrR family transcriptional regulator
MALASRRDELLSAARKLLAELGREGLTMRRLGSAAGIRAPSLYKHFRDKGELERSLAAAGWDELAGLIAAWCSERGGDLARVERGHRRFATENRALYRLMAGALSPAEVAAACGPLERLAGSPVAARKAFAALHGEALLELAGA